MSEHYILFKMIKLFRTDSGNKDFIELVRLLDAELAERDGEDHSFYDQFNAIADLKHTVIAVRNDIPVGCGAIKKLNDQSVEVKRMYVINSQRGKGIAGMILTELERWSVELGYPKCRLETGKRQPEAIALYEKKGYLKISNYGQYKGIENSLCFEKLLNIANKT